METKLWEIGGNKTGAKKLIIISHNFFHKKKGGIFVNRNGNVVPLRYQNSGGTTERVGSGRAAARHTLRKGSGACAQRLRSMGGRARQHARSRSRRKTKVSETNLIFNVEQGTGTCSREDGNKILRGNLGVLAEKLYLCVVKVKRYDYGSNY